MREKFICAHFATSWHCKIGSKAHFFVSPPPLLFRPIISVFSTFPRSKSVFGRFFEETHSFFAPRSPLFSRLASFWVRLRAIFREIFPTFPSALPFLHSVKAFSFRASLSLPSSSPSFSNNSLSAPHSPHLLHSLPHFLSHSSPLFHLPPQLTHERTLARNTRVRVRLHPSTRQEVFVYCIHLFTHPSQSTGHQCIRCEGKQEKAFTIYTTTSQSRH